MQDGLCKAFASLGSFQGRSTFSTWLTSIVKNAALMAMRRKKSRPEACLDELLEAQSKTLTRTDADVRDTGRIEALNPGGGNFGPDGRYFVGLRSTRTIVALPNSLDRALENLLPPQVVPFPRGFAFGHDGRLFLASGQGDNTILAFNRSTPSQFSRLVADPELSPLDLAVAPNGNVVVSSEQPFGAVDAVTSVREYDPKDGDLVRVFSPKGKAEFRKPRRLRFAPNGVLYCVARDEVVGFDFASGECLGGIARLPRLNGQALEFFPC
jgi:hypothetical protein